MSGDPRPRSPASFAGAGPVDWALGKAFVHELGKTLLYYLFPDRVDARDWMQAEPLPFDAGAPPAPGDTWFDFVSDTGDSPCIVYSVAYLVHGGLALENGDAYLADHPPELTAPLRVTASDATNAELPRGAFLYVGGDTAYPVADERTVGERFIAPFDYAYETRFPNGAPPPRPLCGIPGNHDWYDGIDGFNRVFRRSPPPPEGTSSTPPARPRGYAAVQQASYFAANLPGNWTFWAFDARGASDVDHRQRAFFHRLPSPRNLLLATPLPAVVYGTAADWTAEFIRDELTSPARDALRLWYSGDLHHYARYDAVTGLGARAFTSLVSGLGGASLHASAAGEHAARASHPSIEQAEREVRRKLFSPFYMLSRTGLLALGFVLGLAGAAGALGTAGEAALLLRPLEFLQALRAPDRTLTPPDGPWILIALALSGILLFFSFRTVKSRMASSESAARRHSPVHRATVAASPLLILILGSVAVAQEDARTFGGVLLDLSFYLAVLALLGGFPLALAAGLREKSPLRRAALAAIGVAFGAIVLALAVVFAFVLERTLGTHPLAIVAAGVLAALGVALLFPLLAAPALAGTFALGAHRPFVSSLAAIDKYGAFIRFRLRTFADGRSILTGFVISVKTPVSARDLAQAEPGSPSLVPGAELIDVFAIDGHP
ncbi:MAG TPA: hypothetical protein VGK73_35805 [Polyangiaceae bacterium]